MNHNLVTIAALLLAGSFAVLAQGQPPAGIVAHQLSSNVYWMEGDGGHSGLIIGERGVILIDAKMTEAGVKQLLAEIAKITSKPLTTVILTHSDQDHVNGLAYLPEGITVIAHTNCKKEMETAIAQGGRSAPPSKRLPTRVVNGNKEELTIEGVRLQLLYWGPAHTSGDMVVYLPSEKIAFIGDLVMDNRPDPLIHQAKQGSSAGWISAVKTLTALDAERMVSGHGNVLDKAAVQKILAAASAKREKIRELAAQGKSLDEIRAAVGDPAPATAAPGGFSFPSFTEVVYNELTKK